MNKNNIVLTGIERSGTTLVCHLLNKLPDSVALHEPMKIRKFSKFESRAALCDAIVHYFEKSRRSLLASGQAISQHVGGKIPDNTFSEETSEFGLRVSVDIKGTITIDKPLSENFLLCIKHLGPFAALLDKLPGHVPCYAVVRNPLAILASWNSIDLPVRDGRHPAVEKMDERFASELKGIEDRFERQIRLLDWHFEKFTKHLPVGAVLRYEDVIESNGKCLVAITPAAETLSETLSSKNKNKLYDFELMKILGVRLCEYDGTFWRFYSKDDVEALIW